MSKPAKQALTAQLTAALVPVLPFLPAPLPTGVAQAVDELADSILRWQARQDRPVRPSGRPELSTSDALVLLMDSRFAEETEGLFHEVEEQDGVTLTAPSPPPSPDASTAKPKRPRLLKPRPSHK